MGVGVMQAPSADLITPCTPLSASREGSVGYGGDIISTEISCYSCLSLFELISEIPRKSAVNNTVQFRNPKSAFASST
jgi:hypothetical protein